jgi:hypothetical protein
VFATSPLRNVTFDLRPLVSPDMYGPIIDTDLHQLMAIESRFCFCMFLNQNQIRYYISICDKTDRRHACKDKDGKEIESFICQVTNEGVGIDIGDLMSFVPRSPPLDVEGFNLTFSRGALCGNGKTRNVTIMFVCDPDGARGNPSVPAGHADVEFSVCEYEFIWYSLYACPLCSDVDFHAVAGECDPDTSTQPIFYQWKDSPKRCHDGVALPAPHTRSCVPSTLSCEAGYYAQANGCVPSPPGNFVARIHFTLSSIKFLLPLQVISVLAMENVS